MINLGFTVLVFAIFFEFLVFIGEVIAGIFFFYSRGWLCKFVFEIVGVGLEDLTTDELFIACTNKSKLLTTLSSITTPSTC